MAHNFPILFEDVKPYKHKLRITGLRKAKLEEELAQVFKNTCKIKEARMLEQNVAEIDVDTKMPYKTLLYAIMGYTFPDERSIQIELLKTSES